MGIVVYTRDQVADMVADGSCVGKKFEFTYRTGQNRDYPLTMEFVASTFDDDREVEYILHNPNTEKYREPQLMTYRRDNFINSMRQGMDDVESIRLVNDEIAWEL
jgi:hypothetical protein